MDKIINSIKRFFEKRITFYLILKKGNGLTHFLINGEHHLEIFKTNKIFIKYYLKLSTKNKSYKISVSNKYINNSYCIIYKEKENGSKYYFYLKYTCNNYDLEFCTNHILKLFNNKIPNKIYISIEKI